MQLTTKAPGKRTAAAAVGVLVLGLAAAALADHRLDGTYELGRWGSGSEIKVKLWVQNTHGRNFKVFRQALYSDGTETNQSGEAVLSGTWLRATFYEKAGLSGSLDGTANSDKGKETGRGIYGIRNDGTVVGLFTAASGMRVYERGDKGPDQAWPSENGSADDGGNNGGGTNNGGTNTGPVRIAAPAAGTYLAGQTLALQVEPAAATVSIEGPATRTADGIQLTGAGDVTIKAAQGSDEATISLRAIEAQLTKVEVLERVEISDARGAAYERALNADEAAQVPQAIFSKQPLKLRIRIAASDDLSAAAEVEVEGEASSPSLHFSKRVDVRALKAGVSFEVASDAPLSQKVSINALDLGIKVAGRPLAQRPQMRVYTTFKAPIKNIDRDVNAPNTLIHFENACRWARNAGENVGQGADSIAWNCDNMMRHFVHPSEQQGVKIAVPDYAADAPTPFNYEDIYGWVSNGERRVSSLYYPPLDAKKPYEEYENYRNNFGWWVLDNPQYVGGRCNQQASLVCGIMGTLGIKGEILYLHRFGRGVKSGRPVRQYFYSNDSWPATSATGGGPWNFHGVALITLGDGSEWIYDGSFSSPPDRKNGTREWAENPGGPFLHSWGPWLYDDYMGGRVPADDIPSTWQGIQGH